MASPSDLRPKQSCGCEAFQSPRPRRFSHDVAQVSIPIQQARASAWTALRSSRSIVVLLMLFQPEHDVSSWHFSELRTSPTNVRSSNGSRHRACRLSVVGKTCKQAVAHGRLVVGAIEMTWLFAPRSFLICRNFWRRRKYQNRQVTDFIGGPTRVKLGTGLSLCRFSGERAVDARDGVYSWRCLCLFKNFGIGSAVGFPDGALTPLAPGWKGVPSSILSG